MGCCQAANDSTQLKVDQQNLYQDNFSCNDEFFSFDDIYYYSARNNNDQQMSEKQNQSLEIQAIDTQLQEIAQKLDEKKSQFLEMVKIDNGKWQLEKKTKQLIVHKYFDDKGIVIARGEGEINCSSENALNFLFFDMDCVIKTKPQLSIAANYQSKTHPQTHQEYIFQYSRSKGIMFISEREFVLCKTYWKQEDGTTIAIATSVEDNENYPENQNKFVRATSFINGYLFIPKENNKCQLICIQHVTPGGSVPQSLANKNSLDSGQLPLLLNNYLKTHLEPNRTPFQKL